MADPNLDLFDTQGVKIGTNDNWKDAQIEAIQATNAAPPNDLESALIADLPAGNYTAIVSGVAGKSGVTLVEAYHLE